MGVISDYHHARLRQKEGTRCYNVGQNTYSTFAVLFSKATFKSALAWLDSTDQPLYMLPHHLSELGFVVRSAFPYIAIQRTDQPPVFEGIEEELSRNITTSEARISIHKWSLANYCFAVASRPQPGL
jgi:hypothetical protein